MKYNLIQLKSLLMSINDKTLRSPNRGHYAVNLKPIPYKFFISPLWYELILILIFNAPCKTINLTNSLIRIKKFPFFLCHLAMYNF